MAEQHPTDGTVRIGEVEQLVRELGRIGELTIHLMDDGARWWVSFVPKRMAPLWWYACETSLAVALGKVAEEAVRMGYLKRAA